ncbi:MAG: TonB-dependent receptor plug domain-containing protein [Cytophagaceae bacterium]|nr:TonB-dependent receptor plug domain-containing protein [Cytophagaceae bacterium]
MLKRRLFYLGMLVGSMHLSMAQTDSTSLEDLSLEELLNVKIVSASRAEESAFEAPLSSYVITRQEIEKSGVTSLPDALRLCPAVTIKEVSNGVFSITIKGFENLPTHQYSQIVKTILVMIDNRPVFDYLSGGTLWQNLPVDLVDIERIEVVCGPNSPLYGPNAVNGVINIITRKVSNDGVYATANQSIASHSTYIGSVGLGYKAGKFSGIASMNFNQRDRFAKDEYYRPTNDDYVTLDTLFQPQLILDNFPRPGQAFKKTSGNLFLNYTASDKVKVNLSSGINDSYALFPLAATSGLSTFTNQSKYIGLSAEVYNATAQVSILNGYQGLVGAFKNFGYKYNNFDAYLDYNVKIGKKLSIRPALNYQEAFVDDREFTVEKNITGVFNQSATMYNVGTSVKADYNTKKFRIIGALRADKFKFPDDYYISYQAIGNYKINSKNILRVLYGKSNSGSYMGDTYANFVTATIPAGVMGPFPMLFTYQGNKDRKLPICYTYEIGYRMQVSSVFQADVAVYRQEMSQFTKDVLQDPVFDMSTMVINAVNKISDLKLKAVQQGTTLAFNFVLLDGKINFKPSLTYQVTQLSNYTGAFFTQSWNPTGNVDSTYKKKHTGSPDLFGSFYLNVNPVEKLNININGNYYSASQMFTLSNQVQGSPFRLVEKKASNIPGGVIMNAKISYAFSDMVTGYVSGRNVLNTNARQYFGSDRIMALYMVGVSFTY